MPRAGRWPVRAENVRSVAGVLGVRYRQLANGEFNHTSALLLLDREGRIVARSERIGGAADPAFVGAVRRVLAPPRVDKSRPRAINEGRPRGPCDPANAAVGADGADGAGTADCLRCCSSALTAMARCSSRS